MDETNWPSDFYTDTFSLGFDKKCIFFFKLSYGRASTFPIISSKVITDHAFAWESFSYINKDSKTEILTFC